VAVVREDYPSGQVSKEDFANVQQAIGQLVDELPEEEFTPRVGESYWAKGAAIMVCDDEATRDWLATKVPTLAACMGAWLKLVGLEDFLTYRRVVAWFLGHGAVLLAAPEVELGSGDRTLEGVRAQGGTQWGPPCAQCRLIFHRCTGGARMEALQWSGTCCLLSTGR
jgi:hypothetical protein